MIELRNISKNYQMGNVEVKALQDVSLKIAPGEFVAIMGPSGSGKSTLLHILGLLDRPDSGEYYLGNRKINELSDKELSAIRSRLAGFVFQQFHLLPRMTALENVELPLVYAGKRQLKDTAQQKLEEVGLSERITHRPNELSGGQQQRVAIARSLVNEPLIILADEPTGNLDSKSREEIISILKELNQKGNTVIIVTHEKEIATSARHVIDMLDGRIISDEESPIPQKSSKESQVDKIIDGVLSTADRKARRIEFFAYSRQAGTALLTHKMRSFLSILGILIGVAAVITMLGLGQGAKEAIKKQFEIAGANLLMVRARPPKVRGVTLPAGVVTRFTFQDLSAIEKLTDVVKIAYPSVSQRGQIVHKNKNWNTVIEGVGVNFVLVGAPGPAVGRFFTEEEVKTREKVALLCVTVAKELFGDSNPIGETIKINFVNFKVIGVLRVRGGGGSYDLDDRVFIPITTAMYRLFGKDYIDAFYVEAKSADLIDAAKEAVSKVIIEQHHRKKNEESSFQIQNISDIKSALESTTKTMSLLLSSIAAISLLIGGIGIMNIMLVSVTERTREIGLRKAIGATKKDIVVQFLIEAILMSFIGGIAGILLGIGTSVYITSFAGWAMKISLFSITLATTFSLMVGIAFGLWPAQKASTLDPIEALRYE